mmetsp:Transcript_31241/g.61858  ORF Transcript_31241/g.61858 Transcript_31241/m.61858 type:complete len:194 (+) Transcript_31241:506-1087(+)
MKDAPARPWTRATVRPQITTASSLCRCLPPSPVFRRASAGRSTRASGCRARCVPILRTAGRFPPRTSAETQLYAPVHRRRIQAFVASNRFGIKPGFEKDFEDMWAARDTSLADLPGFVNFQLLRREGSADDDGNTYVSYTTWDSAQAFNNWRGSENFKKSHSNRGGDKESPYSKMPKVVTFKTFLVTSAEGGM